MKNPIKFLIIVISSIIIIFLSLLLVPTEGPAGLIRHIILKAQFVFLIAVFFFCILTDKKKEAESLILKLTVLISIAVLSILSIPEIKDFTVSPKTVITDSYSIEKEHIKDLSGGRFYLVIPSGEKIVISRDRYFDLLGKHITLKIEYFPNSGVALSVTESSPVS